MTEHPPSGDPAGSATPESAMTGSLHRPDAETTPEPEEPDLDAIERDLDEVERALDRLADGTYESDEVTGSAIADEVLDTDPTVHRA